MWKTTAGDGFPDPGVECFVWAPGWPRARIGEAFTSGDAQGFSNTGGELEGVTHYLPLGYPPNPEEAAPVAAKSVKRKPAG